MRPYFGHQMQCKENQKLTAFWDPEADLCCINDPPYAHPPSWIRDAFNSSRSELDLRFHEVAFSVKNCDLFQGHIEHYYLQVCFIVVLQPFLEKCNVCFMPARAQTEQITSDNKKFMLCVLEIQTMAVSGKHENLPSFSSVEER